MLQIADQVLLYLQFWCSVDVQVKAHTEKVWGCPRFGASSNKSSQSYFWPNMDRFAWGDDLDELDDRG